MATKICWRGITCSKLGEMVQCQGVFYFCDVQRHRFVSKQNVDFFGKRDFLPFRVIEAPPIGNVVALTMMLTNPLSERLQRATKSGTKREIVSLGDDESN